MNNAMNNSFIYFTDSFIIYRRNIFCIRSNSCIKLLELCLESGLYHPVFKILALDGLNAFFS